jgi:alkaline phosphatase D
MPLSRRQFTRSSLAAGAAPLLPAAQSAQPAPFPLDHRPPAAIDVDFVLSRLALGSCCKQHQPAPALAAIAAAKPDLYLWLGDNIYADTLDMAKMRADYHTLAAKPEYAALVETCPVIAVWDDHDYGWNDAGRDYQRKEESKAIFLEFFNEPAVSRRRDTSGIYTSHLLGPEDRRVQIILLDLRTFRTAQLTGERHYTELGNYIPDPSPDATMLGEDQWSWLEEQLRTPARLRLIGMSTQLTPTLNGFELWHNYPAEQERLLQLIRNTRAEGVIFLAGDTHWAELSVLEPPGIYPLYELTGSAINQSWDPPGGNARRLFSAYPHPNFATVEIDWDQPDPLISLSAHDHEGNPRIHFKLPLSTLSFNPQNLASPVGPDAFAGTWQSRFGTITFKPQDDSSWLATYGDQAHTCKLTAQGTSLSGTWHEGARTGAVEFHLTRHPLHINGAYGRADGPALLDWACWRTPG